MSSSPTDSFCCQRCGDCCRWPGSVLLEPADIAAAAAALDVTEAEFIERYTTLARNRAQLTLKEGSNGECKFLDETGWCRMYAARPRQCRDFPYGWRVAGCPGLDGIPLAREKRR